MTNYSVQGGPAVPAKVVTTGNAAGGPAIPVYQILSGDGIQVQGGPGIPMKLITDPAYPRLGGPALPIQFVAPGISPHAIGGAAVPVYCVNEADLLAAMGGGETLPWYLTDGLTAADVVCAYQPKGAVSQAESYKNIANPGTNDAAIINAPVWLADKGWVFNGGDQYLKVSNIVLNEFLTIIVRYFEHSFENVYYALTGNEEVLLSKVIIRFGIDDGPTVMGALDNQNAWKYSAPNSSDILGLNLWGLYINGILDTPMSGEPDAFSIVKDLIIGGTQGAIGQAYPFQGAIPCFVVYNKTLTDVQMLAISNNMADL